MHEGSKDWLFNTIYYSEKPIDKKETIKNLPVYLKQDIPNLISEESFYCKIYDKKETRFKMLDRIYQIFPEAKIMLGIRDKESLLISWYKQYVAAGGIYSFDDFIKHIMYLKNLNYEEYIERIQKLYGEKNVFVYEFNNLSKNQENTIKEIYRFFGCSVPKYKVKKRNVGYGIKEIKVALLLNKLFKSEVHDRGIRYPYDRIFLPHRYFFQSKLYRPFLKEKIELEDLIKQNETRKTIEPFL